MNKKLLDLLEKINAKKDEVKNLANEGNLEEAKKAKDELKELQDKFDILKDLDDGAAVPENKVPAGTPKDSTAEFAQAARVFAVVKPNGTDKNGLRNAEKMGYLEYGVRSHGQEPRPVRAAAVAQSENAVMQVMEEVIGAEVDKL